MVKKTQQNETTLKDDGIFQSLFSRKGNEEFLVDFLNSLLGIEIQKITINEEVNIEKLSKEEKGGRILIDGEKKEWIDMASKNNATVKKAVVQYHYLTADEEERRLQDLRQKWALERSASEDYFRELGRIAGERKGKIIGKIKEKAEIAKKMKDKNMNIEEIIELTGLTKEEIEKL